MGTWRGVVSVFVLLVVLAPAVLAQTDTDPPLLNDFDFNPRSVDVTTDPERVICSVNVSDWPTGVRSVECFFESPTTMQRSGCGINGPATGTIYHGTFRCELSIYQYVEAGEWRVTTLRLGDFAGNYTEFSTSDLEGLGFPTTLQVVSAEDSTGPSLIDFDFNPKNVDVTTGPSTVTCDSHVSDVPAGVHLVRCEIYSPTTTQRSYCTALSPASGTVYDGMFSCELSISEFAEEGERRISKLSLLDRAGNVTEMRTSDLEGRGFPTTLDVGFLLGEPRCNIVAPLTARVISGDSVTARARLAQGSPAEVSQAYGVRFDYRAIPFGEFAPIPARNPNHPNPDTSYPYFTHWDVSAVPDGDYELRAVAHDLAGTPDPAPETITITIDHGGPPNVEEYVNAEGRQESQTAVDSASESRIASGDHTEASTATDLTLPPGSLLYTTDTAKLVYPDSADEEGQLEQPEQSIGAFVDLSLLSGQTDLEAGQLGDLNISYADANQDGVVDGTSIREDDLELRHLDTGTGSYIVIPSIVLTEHNMVHAEPGFLGKFALAGPLMPQMWIEADKATVTWEAVSTATSYVVYRGLLSALVDLDLDGLPDNDFGDCMTHLDGDPTDLLFFDPDDPGAGDGFYYLVGFVGADGATGLGNTSAGMQREPNVACP